MPSPAQPSPAHTAASFQPIPSRPWAGAALPCLATLSVGAPDICKSVKLQEGAARCTMHHIRQCIRIHTCVDPDVCLHSLHRLAVEQQCSAVTPGWRVATLCTAIAQPRSSHQHTGSGLCSGSVTPGVDFDSLHCSRSPRVICCGRLCLAGEVVSSAPAPPAAVFAQLPHTSAAPAAAEIFATRRRADSGQQPACNFPANSVQTAATASRRRPAAGVGQFLHTHTYHHYHGHDDNLLSCSVVLSIVL